MWKLPGVYLLVNSQQNSKEYKAHPQKKNTWKPKSLNGNGAIVHGTNDQQVEDGAPNVKLLKAPQ